MAYSDYPGRSLVNNLNLIVTDPAGRVHYGNANQGHSVPEVKNNVEVVHVERPTPGEWSIAVAASSIPHGPQPFALVGLGAFGSVPRWS
jgi:hypothetical protein